MIALLFTWGCSTMQPDEGRSRRNDPGPTSEHVSPTQPSPEPQPTDSEPTEPIQPTEPVRISFDEASMVIYVPDVSGVPTQGFGLSLTVLDVDGDGNDDILSSAKYHEFLLKYQPGTFTGVENALGVIEYIFSSSAVPTGDLDGDGDVDVGGFNYAVIGPSSMSVVFMPFDEAVPAATWDLGDTTRTTGAGSCVTDIDHDGHNDLLFLADNSSLIVGYGPFAPGQSSGPTRWFAPSERAYVGNLQCLGDVTGDGFVDLVASDLEVPIVIPGPLLRDQAGLTYPLWAMATDRPAIGAARAECAPSAMLSDGGGACIASDGLRMKVLALPLVPEPSDAAGSILIGTANRQLGDAKLAAILDFNGDGWMDYVASYQNYTYGQGLYIYLGPHDRVRTEEEFDAFIEVDVTVTASGDFNGDGFDDLVISEDGGANFENVVSVFLGRPI